MFTKDKKELDKLYLKYQGKVIKRSHFLLVTAKFNIIKCIYRKIERKIKQKIHYNN